MESTTRDSALTVTQLTREIREVLEGRIGTVWVEGEVSNHRQQSSGHHYFTLKDHGAQLSCVMFRGAAGRLETRLGDGLQILVQGEISVYEPRGQYQMVVKQALPKGQGSLQARFEALKRKLHEEGLFDPERKRRIPAFPSVVALVTSPTGAAVQDMLNILTRRAPWVRVLVFPVRVQGQGVEAETIRALAVLNAAAEYGLPQPDTIVIGRGGGSIEDMWAYNEESLARAIFASTTPVVSAVGHEIDFTIADFVADLRAPTPSAAAELLAPDAGDLRRQLEALCRSLCMRVETVLEHHQRIIELFAKGALKREPQRLLTGAEQLTDEFENRLRIAIREQWRLLGDTLGGWQQVLAKCHPRLMLTESSHRVDACWQRLEQGLKHRLVRLEDRMRSRADVLRNLGPESILARGFSYTTDATGKVLKEAEQVASGDEIITRLARGTLRSRVD